MVNPRTVSALTKAYFFSEFFSRLKDLIVPDFLLNANLNAKV